MANKKNREQTLNDKLPLAKTSGNVMFGYKCTLKCLYEKTAKLIILTKNIPEHQRKIIENISKLNDIFTFNFDGNNNDLAIAADISYSTGCLAILEEGTSNIIKFIRNKAATN